MTYSVGFFLTVVVFNLTFLPEVQIFWGPPILTVKSRALVTLMRWQPHGSGPAGEVKNIVLRAHGNSPGPWLFSVMTSV